VASVIALRNPKAKAESQRSLFGEIIDWMLAPLLFVWPISIAVTHYFATTVAAYPYDQTLRESVNAIARQVSITDGRASLAFPDAARSLLRADQVDIVYFHVVYRDGRHIGGDREMPLAEDILRQPDEPGETYFRTTEVAGEELRIAYQYIADPALPRNRWVLVEVGETTEKRGELTNKIVASVILPQFIIIPLAVILVWFGLSQGLRPLTRLRQRIESRRPGDLSEISTRRVPEELEPLVAAFNAMLERLRRNLEAQQRFIADAAHQLRTPLTGLKTQAQSAQGEEDPATLRQVLGNVAQGVDRASRLVNQLLALARAEASDRQHPFVPLDLRPVLQTLAGEWWDRAQQAGVDIGFEETGQAWIIGNEFLLCEMFNNLVDNALRYSPAGGSTTCRVLPHGDFVIVEVEDSGMGISHTDAELVFDRFYRVNDAGAEGSGLGLAIVREIAELHRADATLRPNPRGKGSVARVVFPAYRRQKEEDAATESEAGGVSVAAAGG
jgi:two-component system sensor histidine kinase TctE